jgi:hypothetical protein
MYPALHNENHRLGADMKMTKQAEAALCTSVFSGAGSRKDLVEHVYIIIDNIADLEALLVDRAMTGRGQP